MTCKCCDEEAVYRCYVCGRPICGKHALLRTVCSACKSRSNLKYGISRTKSENDMSMIRSLVQRFWGEEEQLTFDRQFKVTELPAFIAKTQEKLVGFVSFAKNRNSLIIVALGVLPKYQNMGIGTGLVRRIEAEAKRTKKRMLLVSTSNDDLPALAFYQSLGFQMYEVKPDVIAEKHGKVLEGIGRLPVRDEIRLRKPLSA